MTTRSSSTSGVALRVALGGVVVMVASVIVAMLSPPGVVGKEAGPARQARAGEGAATETRSLPGPSRSGAAATGPAPGDVRGQEVAVVAPVGNMQNGPWSEVVEASGPFTWRSTNDTDVMFKLDTGDIVSAGAAAALGTAAPRSFRIQSAGKQAVTVFLVAAAGKPPLKVRKGTAIGKPDVLLSGCAAADQVTTAACTFLGAWEYLGDSWHCCVNVTSVEWPQTFRIRYGDNWNGDSRGLLVRLDGNELRTLERDSNSQLPAGSIMMSIGEDGSVYERTPNGSPLRRHADPSSDFVPPAARSGSASGTSVPAVGSQSTRPNAGALDDILAQADSAISRGDYDRALVEAERAVRQSPADPRARALLDKVRRIRSILK